jgi:quercetin dioxygenase-like cupin family protein
MAHDSPHLGPSHRTGADHTVAAAAFAAEGLVPQSWANAPGVRYEEHRHAHHKVLLCVAGSITFHTEHRDFVLGPGDRLDLPAGTAHAATVGADGVTCMEAYRKEDPR